MTGMMEFLFWLILALIAYTYVGYPLLLVLLSRVINRPIRRDPEYRPTVTILVCALNEGSIIEEKVRNCLALEYPEGQLEIAVASDGSTDSTAEVVGRFADQGVKLFDYQVNRGKVLTLNETIPQLSGEIVVLSDASVMYDPQAIINLVPGFSDPEVGGIWGDKIYRNPGEVISGEGESLYLRYEKFSKRCENRLGSIVSAEGSMFAIRKSIYQPMPDPAVADDYYLSAYIRHRGYRLVYEPLARSFEDVAPTSSDEYRRKVRIIQGGLRGFWLMRHLCNPMKTGVYSIQIFTRQFLRRAVALLFPLLLLLNLLIVLRQPSLFYGALLLGQLGIIFLALAGWRIVSDKGRAPFLIYAPYYFAMVNLASVHGMWNWVSGKQAVSWDPTTRK